MKGASLPGLAATLVHLQGPEGKDIYREGIPILGERDHPLLDPAPAR